MSLKQGLRKTWDYLHEPELYVGGAAGFIGGAIAGLKEHYSEYLDRLHSVESFLEHIEVGFQFAVKSLDELAIGAGIGLAIGAGVHFIRRRIKR